MQTSEKGVYTGAIDVVKKSVAREGLRKVCGQNMRKNGRWTTVLTLVKQGLYAGVSAPLVGVTPMCEHSQVLSAAL